MDDISNKIYDNMGLVYKQLNKFGMLKDPEAYSYACEALLNAINTFDESKKVHFSTYACVCIYNALGSYLRKKNKKTDAIIISYNNLIDEDNREHPTEYGYFIGSYKDEPECSLISNERYEHLKASIIIVLNSFTGNAYTTLKLWIDSEFKLNQTELSELVGVAQSTVSRFISSFRNKLRKKLGEF